MRGVLVDTHAALWASLADPRLSRTAIARLEDPRRPRYLSMASAHELAVKAATGKLDLKCPLSVVFSAFLHDLGLEPLPVGFAHCVELSALPMHHRDPFDRMLVAQARVEGLEILTIDAAFSAYDVTTVW